MLFIFRWSSRFSLPVLPPFPPAPSSSPLLSPFLPLLFFSCFYFVQKSTGKLGIQNNSDPIRECQSELISIVRNYLLILVMSHHANFLPFLLLLNSPSSYVFFSFFYVFPSPSYSFATALRCTSYRDYSKEKGEM